MIELLPALTFVCQAWISTEALAGLSLAGAFALEEHGHLACGESGRLACGEPACRQDARIPHRRDGCAPAGAFAFGQTYRDMRVILFTVLLP